MLKFIFILFASLILCCSCNKKSYTVVNQYDDIVWKNEFAKNKLDNTQPTYSVNELSKTEKVQDLKVRDLNKSKIKKTFIEKIIEKKVAKFTSKVSNPNNISKEAKVLNKNKSQANFNWLWSVLLFIGVLFLAAVLTKYFGPIAGLCSLIAILILLYLILPEDLSNAMGQAAVITILNVVLQLIISMI